MMQAREILKGNTRKVLSELKTEMETLADDLRFEDAEEVKKRYLALEGFASRSEVVSHTIDNVDVFSITSDDNIAYINYIHVASGAINQSFTIEYRKKLNETDEELLQLGIVELRERFKSQSKEIIVPRDVKVELDGVTFTIPQRGDKRTLLELSEMNCKQYKFDRLKQAEKLNPEQKQVRLMKELQDRLHLPKLPYQIECFDNSNISGSDAVAACVVFKSMKPSKKDYKKYNIKTVVGPDDYASMKEVVHRRYSRLLEEEQPLPDLIVADGGRGQMEVIREVIQDELNLDIPIAGLAKNDRHRTNELLYGFPPISVQLKTDSELFHVLTRLQDEVHRFAITFHRDKRSKHALASELDEVKGVGPKTKDALLVKFKTIAKIKERSEDELAEVIGKSRANLVYEYFHKK
jgi:excinuclease ABC subunit C